MLINQYDPIGVKAPQCFKILRFTTKILIRGTYDRQVTPKNPIVELASEHTFSTYDFKLIYLALMLAEPSDS